MNQTRNNGYRESDIDAIFKISIVIICFFVFGIFHLKEDKPYDSESNEINYPYPEHLIITSSTNTHKNHGHDIQENPTVFIHSSVDPEDSSLSDFIGVACKDYSYQCFYPFFKNILCSEMHDDLLEKYNIELVGECSNLNERVKTND